MLKVLLARELAFLIMFGAVGVGFTTLLPRQLDAATRLALAPLFGLAASVSLLTTLNFFTPLKHAFWFVLLPAAALSILVAVWRTGRPRMSQTFVPRWRDLAGLVVVAVVVTTVYNLPQDERSSHGPTMWAVADAPGYTQCIEAFAQHTNDNPLTGFSDAGTAFTSAADREAPGGPWNLADRYCWFFKFQHNGSMTVPAAMSSPLGLYPWQSLAPFMVALALVAAFGAFALFRIVTGSTSLVAVLAGVSIAGASVFQVFVDGAAGMLSALAFIPGLLAVLAITLEKPRWRSTILCGLVAAGLQTCYPEIGTVIAGTVAIALFYVLVRHLRAGGRLTAALRVGAPHLLAVGVLALALSPRAALWAQANAEFANAAKDSSSLPTYLLAPKYAIGWLFQTRDFYSFATAPPLGSSHLAAGTVFPIVLLAIIAWSAVRLPRLWLLVALAAVAASQAIYLNQDTGCTYCINRSLLPVAPIAVVAALVGLRELAVSGRTLAAGFLGGLLAFAAGASAVSIEHRATRGGYMPPGALLNIAREVDERVDDTLQLEGFATTPFWAYAESPLVYGAMSQATSERLSVVAAYDEFGGYSYLRPRPIGDSSYTPDYEYVVSRLPLIETGRTVLARTRYAVLSRRSKPFDAVVAGGVATNGWTRDPEGFAWVQKDGGTISPLTFWVSAQTRQRAYLRLRFAGNPSIRPSGDQRSWVARDNLDGTTDVCFPVPGAGARRIATLRFDAVPGGIAPAAPGPDETDPPDDHAPRVLPGLRLDAVRASPDRCPRPIKPRDPMRTYR